MDIFGDDYYLEIQRHDIDPEAKVNDGLLKLHRKLGVPLVATNDFPLPRCHRSRCPRCSYLHPDRQDC